MTQLIELTLNPEIISVDGVVNGESYAFALTDSVDGMGIWTAAVARAEDDIYRVSITAANQSGTSTQLTTIIYYDLHLITDRTQDDVNRVKELLAKGWANMTADEQAEWSAGIKGAYNNSDINRVQSAVRYLRDRLEEVGYSVIIPEARTWTQDDAPTQADMQQYLDDVRAIRSVFTLLNTTPNVPNSMARLTFTRANDIEQILFDVDRLLSNMVASFVYSGEFYGGEV